VRGLLRTMPLLVVRDDVHPLLPVFQPPSFVQRTVGGVRDAARIELGSAGDYKQVSDVPVRALLEVIVFNRAVRANAWSELLEREMDVRDQHYGQPQVRVEGADTPDGVWLIAPRAGGGIATVAGVRGPVGFELRVVYQRANASNPEDLIDLSARAEVTARQAAADWADWLQRELGAS